MASVAFQNGDDRAQGPQLLDLDSGPEPPQWLQVVGSAILIIAVAVLVCLWLKPLTHSRPSPNAFTVPAIRTLIPEHQIVPESTTVGPMASGAMPLLSDPSMLSPKS